MQYKNYPYLIPNPYYYNPNWQCCDPNNHPCCAYFHQSYYGSPIPFYEPQHYIDNDNLSSDSEMNRNTPRIVVTPTKEDELKQTNHIANMNMMNDRLSSASPSENSYIERNESLKRLSEKLSNINKVDDYDDNSDRNDSKKYRGDHNKMNQNDVSSKSSSKAAEVSRADDDNISTSEDESSSTLSSSSLQTSKGDLAKSRSSLPAKRSVSNINVYAQENVSDEDEEEEEDEEEVEEEADENVVVVVEEFDDEQEEGEDDTTDNGDDLTEDPIINGEHLPHQLSVIFEENDSQISQLKSYPRRDSVVSNSSTLSDCSTTLANDIVSSSDEDIDELNGDNNNDDDVSFSSVTVRLPLKLSFSRSPNNEGVATVTVGKSEVTDNSDVISSSSLASIKDICDEVADDLSQMSYPKSRSKSRTPNRFEIDTKDKDEDENEDDEKNDVCFTLTIPSRCNSVDRAFSKSPSLDKNTSYNDDYETDSEISVSISLPIRKDNTASSTDIPISKKDIISTQSESKISLQTMTNGSSNKVLNGKKTIESSDEDETEEETDTEEEESESEEEEEKPKVEVKKIVVEKKVDVEVKLVVKPKEEVNSKVSEKETVPIALKVEIPTVKEVIQKSDAEEDNTEDEEEEEEKESEDEEKSDEDVTETESDSEEEKSEILKKPAEVKKPAEIKKPIEIKKLPEAPISLPITEELPTKEIVLKKVPTAEKTEHKCNTVLDALKSIEKVTEEVKVSVRDKISVFESKAATPTPTPTPKYEIPLRTSHTELDTGRKSTLSRNSSSLKSSIDESEAEDDSGVTSDMSKHISEVETDSECFPELRKMSRYQRAATHSRLFKLLHDGSDDEEEENSNILQECEKDKVKEDVQIIEDKRLLKKKPKKIVHNVSITRKNNPNVVQDTETMAERRERLSLPLVHQLSSGVESMSSNSPSSPVRGLVNEKLADELVQSLLMKKKGRNFRKLPLEKLHAAAIKILQEDLESNGTLSSTDDQIPTIDSTPALTPQEFKTGYSNSYSDYYDTWTDQNNNEEEVEDYDILPSKAFKNLQIQELNYERKSPWAVRCPRVLSSKTVNKDLSRVSEVRESESPEPRRSHSRSSNRSLNETTTMSGEKNLVKQRPLSSIDFL